MKQIPMKTYQTAHDQFRWEIPATFNFGTDVIDRWATDKDRLALIWLNDKGDEKRFTFHQIKTLSNQFANLLAAQGVQKGDRVVIMLPRLPEWQIAMIGCNRLGAVPVPCITMLTPKDVAYRVHHSDAVAAITTAANAPKFAGLDLGIRISVGQSEGWTDFTQGLSQQPKEFAPPTIRAEDPAVLYYTSGSSGDPKGVLHSSRALFAWRVSAWYWLTASPDDLIWCTADTGWSKAATSILYGPWSCGATALFYDGPFDAEMRLDLLEKYKVTIYCAPSTELRHLLPLDLTGRDLGALRQTISAGESVNPEVVRQWQDKTGALLLDGYGQTETLMTVVNYPALPVKPGSMGKPVPGTDVAILDEGNAIVPTGSTGRLAVKCPNPQIMLGYWKDKARTSDTRVMVHGSEWFITGDMAHMDKEGYLFYDGRDDDIISSSGYRIGPMEVENALMEHGAVKECAAVASPDPDRGEIVKGFVVLHDGFAGDDRLKKQLQDYVKRATAPYKYPREIEFTSDLPKTATGKLSRRVLRDREYAQKAGKAPQ
jgi:acetyl-CoA synthetase